MGYYKDTVRGVGWIGSLRIFTRIISFARTAIIARILSPEQFGLFGIASLALILIEILTETGINVFLVQEKEKIEKYISTAWIVSIVRGILIFLTLIILAPVIGNFYSSPNAVILLFIVSFVPLIRGFINPAVAIFQKELQFSKEFYYRSSIFFVESVVAVVLVLKTHAPEGLVWGLVAGALYEVIVSFIIIRPAPRFSFNFTLMKNVISRGKWVTFSGIFSYLFHNGDNIVIGKMKGVGALGIYDMAYRISMLPITEVADVVAKVTFPVYVKIAHDKKRLQKAFIKSLVVVSMLCLPIGAIFILFPKEIILILLGNKWLEAAQVLQVLAIFGVVRAISGVSSSVFFAVQKQEYTTVITLVSFATLAISIIPFVNMFGLIGAGLAAVLGSLTAVPFIIYYTIRVFKIK